MKYHVLFLFLFIGGSVSQIPQNVSLTPVFESEAGNQFTWPTWMGEIPGKPGDFLVAELFSNNQGKIYLLDSGSNGYTKTKFLSLAARSDYEWGSGTNGYTEMGLMGAAYHPNFVNNRKYYLFYNPPGNMRVAVEERLFTQDFLNDAGQSREIISIDQTNMFHNGGTINFGLDGYLYIGLGDDTQGQPAQDRSNLLGAMLRINVDQGSGNLNYSIPPDNPYVGNSSYRDEIWAFGLRNPWKWSFDSENGDLLAGDVGGGDAEEISLIRSGDNLGWPDQEGRSNCGSETCGGFTEPLIDLTRAEATCIVGGYTYRGNSNSPFYGTYIFGDWATRYIWALPYDRSTRQAGSKVQIARAPQPITSFSEDQRGNIYAVGYQGTIYLLDHPELKPSPPTPIHSVSKKLKIESPSLQDIVNFKIDSPSQIKIIDTKGIVIYSSSNIHSISLFLKRKLNPGIYIIQIKLDHQFITWKEFLK